MSQSRLTGPQSFWIYGLCFVPSLALSTIQGTVDRRRGSALLGVALAESLINLAVALPLTFVFVRLVELHHDSGLFALLASLVVLFFTPFNVLAYALLGPVVEAVLLVVVTYISLCFPLCGVVLNHDYDTARGKWVSYLSVLRYVYDAYLRVLVGNYYATDQGSTQGVGPALPRKVAFDVLVVGASIAVLFAGLAAVGALRVRGLSGAVAARALLK